MRPDHILRQALLALSEDTVGYDYLKQWLKGELTSPSYSSWMGVEGRMANGEWAPAVGYARAVLGLESDLKDVA